MLDMVGNPEGWFSGVSAPLCLICLVQLPLWGRSSPFKESVLIGHLKKKYTYFHKILLDL